MESVITQDAQDRKPIKRPSSIDGYTNITRKYFPVLSALEDVQLYRQYKSDILSAAQQLILKYALSPAKMEKASFIALCQGFEILNKCERLELGKSTDNIAHKILGTIELDTQNDGK